MDMRQIDQRRFVAGGMDAAFSLGAAQALARGDAPMPSWAFIDDQTCAITGYSGNIQDPYISPSGNYLFFNNANTDSNTDVHVASTTADPLTFTYIRKLSIPGAGLQATSSIDSNGNVYFIDNSGGSAAVMVGTFSGEDVTSATACSGLIVPPMFGPFRAGIFDAVVAPDGNRIYISMGIFFTGNPIPAGGFIKVASKVSPGVFIHDPDSDIIMANINTGDGIPYAVCTSADNLELFCSKLISGNPRIYRAARLLTSDPFGPLELVPECTGFCEAPTLTHDGQRLYYHKQSETTSAWELHMLRRANG
jgi:hypothetical protein